MSDAHERTMAKKYSARRRAERLTKMAQDAAEEMRELEKRCGPSPEGRHKFEKELFKLAGEKLVEAFDILMEKAA